MHLRLVVMIGVAACATSPRTRSMVPVRIVDLTPVLEPVASEPQTFENPAFLAMRTVTLFDHQGAHYDPPSHVLRDGTTVDEEPLDKFIGRAHVIDFRGKPRDAGLSRADFEHAGVKAGEVVIAFVGCPAGTHDHCPYLTGDAAEYLATIPVKMFATDAWTIANPALFEPFFAMAKAGTPGRWQDFLPEHHAFLSRGIPNIEGLTNLEPLLGERDVVFVAFPVRLYKGTGAPVRAAALIYE